MHVRWGWGDEVRQQVRYVRDKSFGWRNTREKSSGIFKRSFYHVWKYCSMPKITSISLYLYASLAFRGFSGWMWHPYPLDGFDVIHASCFSGFFWLDVAHSRGFPSIHSQAR